MKARSLFFLLIVVASFFLVAIIVNAEGCCLKTKGDNGQYCVSERDGASAANCESSMWFSEDCDAKDQCKNKGCCTKRGEQSCCCSSSSQSTSELHQQTSRGF